MTEDRDVEMCKLFNLKKRKVRAEYIYCTVGISRNTTIYTVNHQQLGAHNALQ